MAEQVICQLKFSLI